MLWFPLSSLRSTLSYSLTISLIHKLSHAQNHLAEIAESIKRCGFPTIVSRSCHRYLLQIHSWYVPRYQALTWLSCINHPLRLFASPTSLDHRERLFLVHSVVQGSAPSCFNNLYLSVVYQNKQNHIPSALE